MGVPAKYDQLAERFTEHEYGDPGRYFGHRAELAVRLGPRLVAGERVLDLACADASFAEPLLAADLRYTGVDASERMVDVARARLRGRGDAVVGDLVTFRPDEPVAATTIFRSLHFVEDRPAFFAHVAGFTEKKLVLDVDPRRYPLERLRADLAAAGLDRLETHPFFVPQHRALPASLAAALGLVERTGPLARALLRRRFNVVAAAFRG